MLSGILEIIIYMLFIICVIVAETEIKSNRHRERCKDKSANTMMISTTLYETCVNL